MRQWMPSIVLLGFAAMVFTQIAAKSGPEPIAIGQAAPAFSLKDQNGKPVSLADEKGKIVVLEWFNDQCPFVQKHYSTGHMNTLAQTYTSQGVVWLAINSSNFATQASNEQAAKNWKINRPILDDATGKVGLAYGAKNTPEMMIINKEGILAYRGAIDNRPSKDVEDLQGATNYVAKALDELLAGKPVSQPETKPYGCHVSYAE